MIFDRMLDTHGQLLYPVSDDPHSPWLADFFGNVMIVNGRILPYLQVAAAQVSLPDSQCIELTPLPFAAGGRVTDDANRHGPGLLPAPVELKRLAIAHGRTS